MVIALSYTQFWCWLAHTRANSIGSTVLLWRSAGLALLSVIGCGEQREQSYSCFPRVNSFLHAQLPNNDTQTSY